MYKNVKVRGETNPFSVLVGILRANWISVMASDELNHYVPRSSADKVLTL